jgi:hypothetical protein
MLWALCIFILVSATFVLVLARGPFKRTPSAQVLLAVAGVQYLLALVLAGARVLGYA